MMRQTIRFTFALCILLVGVTASAIGQRHHHGRHDSSEGTRENCFDSSEPSEIRLWEGRAPGAIGDDPCRDIPYLKLYAPRGAGSSVTRTAIIVMPGGGYDRLSDRKEQGPVGEFFSSQLRVTTFVLYYRLVQADGSYRYPVPMWDGQRALKLVRSRAAQFGISPNRIGLFGFSAGGHLAISVTEHSATDFDLPRHDSVDDVGSRPDFLALGYPVVSMIPDQFASTNSLGHLLYGYSGRELDRLEHYLSGQERVTPRMPPVFLFESLDDERISSQNSILFEQALRQEHISAEVHLFHHGVHGAGLAEGVPEESDWPGMFQSWLQRQGYL
ncbi:MAG: alpha/beta hydrolase [Terracidiphilus sp.]|jgi:acetyl esterase/lipase